MMVKLQIHRKKAWLELNRRLTFSTSEAVIEPLVVIVVFAMAYIHIFVGEHIPSYPVVYELHFFVVFVCLLDLPFLPLFVLPSHYLSLDSLMLVLNYSVQAAMDLALLVFELD